MTDLVPYDHARILLAEAKTVDDVKQIHDKAAAMAEYRRRAGDRSLEIDAVEIRMFAQRRLGQMLAAQKATVGLHPGGRPPMVEAPKTGTAPEPVLRPTLAEAGITKKLSAQAQKMAALPPEQFEAKLSSWREEARVADRVTTNLLEIGRKQEQRQSRHDLAQTLSDTSAQLTGRRKVACIYADPAVKRKAGIGDRAYENHYPTMDWDAILKLPVRETLLPDAWGFIFLPRAHVLALHPVTYTVAIDDGSLHDVVIKTPLAWAIARAWGFDSFSTMAVWDKTDPEHPDEHGTGLIFWDQCEILCLFKKGRGLPAPIPAQMYGSLIRERARPLGHSAKPPKVRKMIADMVGCDSDGEPLHVLELFARNDPDNPLPQNWEAWGNESASAEQREAAE